MENSKRSKLANLWNLATDEDFNSTPTTARCAAFVAALEFKVQEMGGGDLYSKDTPKVERFKERWFNAWKHCTTDEDRDRCFFTLINCDVDETAKYTKIAEKIRKRKPLTKTQLADELGMSRATLCRREKEHKVRSIPIGGGHTRIPIEEQRKLRWLGIPED